MMRRDKGRALGMRRARQALRNTLLAGVTIVSLWSAAVSAQDQIPPTIEHERIADAVQAGIDFPISAIVTDNVGVSEVTLHFWGKDQDAERASVLEMFPNRGQRFVANLPGSVLKPDVINYFITARDAAGNEDSRGFSFDPLQLKVSNDPVVSARADDVLQDSTASGGIDRKWLIVGGVLGAVAIASLLGGDSTSPSPSSPCPCPVGIRL